jgi:hypothetical protein
MVTYDQYSEPDFFQNNDEAQAADRERRLLRLFGKK